MTQIGTCIYVDINIGGHNDSLIPSKTVNICVNDCVELYYNLDWGDFGIYKWYIYPNYPDTTLLLDTSTTSRSLYMPFFSEGKYNVSVIHNIYEPNGDTGFWYGRNILQINVSYCPPIAGFGLSDTVLCRGDCVEVWDSSRYAPTEWRWKWEGGESKIQKPNEICFADTGWQWVSLWVSNPAGVDSTKRLVYVKEKPLANDTLISLSTSSGAVEQLAAQGDANSVYEWLPQEGLSCTSCPMPLLEVGQATTYTCRAWSANSPDCFVLTTYELQTASSLYIPNAFSPNDDGVNDVFGVTGTELRDFRLTIYDRWGRVFFHAENPAKVWDGSNAPEGVYTFQLRYTDAYNRHLQRVGTITLVR